MPDRLLDTNALRAAMDSNSQLLGLLERCREQGQVVTSIVVESEVRFGLARLPQGRRRSELVSRFRRVMEEIEDVLDITRREGDHYTTIKADLWSRGRPQGDNDLWIAATAIANDMILVTNDSAFRNISGLAVEDWSQD